MKITSCIGMLLRMDRTIHWPALLAMSLLLSACGTMRSSVVVEPAPGGHHAKHVKQNPQPATRLRPPISGDSYVVAKGDTLYSIAFRKGVDFRNLAQWNDIAEPYTIWPGQRVTLLPPARTVAHGTTTPVAKAPPSVGFEPVVTVHANPPAAATSVATAVVALPATTSAPVVVPVAGVPPPTTVPPPAPAAAGVSRVVSGVHWRWPADGSLAGRFKSDDAIPGIEIAGKSGNPVRAAADGVVVYSGSGLVGYGELVIIKHNDNFLSAYGHNRKRLVKEGQRVSAGQQIAEMGSTGTTRNELEFQIRKNGQPVNPLDYLPSR